MTEKARELGVTIKVKTKCINIDYHLHDSQKNISNISNTLHIHTDKGKIYEAYEVLTS